MSEEKFQYPMLYPYIEEIIEVLENESCCFAQWLGPDKIIFGTRHRLFIRDTVESITIVDPLEECKSSRLINCMRSNPSQTRLAVGLRTSVIVYDIPSLSHNGNIFSEKPAVVDEACWQDDDTFAIIINSGHIVIRVWENGSFTERQRVCFIPSYRVMPHEMFKHHIFDYHSGYKEFVYYSHPRTRYFEQTWFLSSLEKPLMIAIHPASSHYLVANHSAIYVLDHETLQDGYVDCQEHGFYSLSVAEHIVTYSINWSTQAVQFKDIRNMEESRYSLISQALGSQQLKPPKRFPRSSKPRINVHSYNNDRTKIFCGGLLRKGALGIPCFHAAIWTVRLPKTQQTCSS